MTDCQLFLKPVEGEGGWGDLGVPDGSRYGIQPAGSRKAGSWHSALTYEYESPADFDVLPVCGGTAHCDFRPGNLHFDVPNRELIVPSRGQSNLPLLGRSFVEPVVKSEYDTLELLPFPDDDSEREDLYESIDSLGSGGDSTIKIVLNVDPKYQIDVKPGPGGSGPGLGRLRYFVYESVDIESLYNGLGVSEMSGEPTGRRVSGIFRGGSFIRQALREDLDVTWDDLFKLFLLGLVTVRVEVPSDITFGKSALHGDPPTRRISLWAFTDYGAIDPVIVLNAFRTEGRLVDSEFFHTPADGGSVEAAFSWTDENSNSEGRLLEDVSLSESDFINNAEEFLYPYSLLRFMREHLGWSKDDPKWRDDVGDAQKAQYSDELLLQLEPMDLAEFFDWTDRYNIFQLEAVAEFFCVGTRSEYGDGRRDGEVVDTEIVVDFLAKAELGWRVEDPRRSGLYLVQIDRMSDIGGPRTAIRMNETGLGGQRSADEYEGCIFLVCGGEIQELFYGFSSFTGKRCVGGAASSIEGNRRYLFRSRKSPSKQGHNYAFIITRDESLKYRHQERLPGWFYWGREDGDEYEARNPGEKDGNGKSWIIIHRGNSPTRVIGMGYEPTPRSWNGSKGCQVAPIDTYYTLRSEICRTWTKYESPQGEANPSLALVAGLSASDSVRVFIETNRHIDYEKSLSDRLAHSDLEGHSEYVINFRGWADLLTKDKLEKYRQMREWALEHDQILPPEQWNHHIAGTYLIVRPFEKQVDADTRLIARPQGL